MNKSSRKDIESLVADLANNVNGSRGEIRDPDISYEERMNDCEALLTDWRNIFTYDNALKCLFENSTETFFQIKVLLKITAQPWVRSQWLKTKEEDTEIFEWLEAIFKSEYKTNVRDIINHGEAKTLQWEWLIYTLNTLDHALPSRNDILENLASFKKLLKLNDVESKLVEFVLARELNPDYSDFFDTLINNTKANGSSLLKRVLNVSISSLNQAFAEDGLLRSLVFEDSNPEDFDVELNNTIRNLLTNNNLLTINTLLTAIVSKIPACELQKSQFAHLEIESLINYLSISLSHRKKGVNILLYGPPGTGKTQLSRLLAEQANAEFYSVDTLRRRSFYADNPRIHKVRLAQQVLTRVDRAMICVDECEELFEKKLLGDVNSKLLLNSLTEDSLVPTIWITNWVHHIEPSLLRRFDIVLNVEAPTRSQKITIYQKQLSELKVENEFCDYLASNESLTQGHIFSAAKVAATLDYSGEKAQSLIKKLLEEQLKPLGETLEKDNYVFETIYKAELSNIKGNCLVDIQQMLIQSRHGRLLLFGPSGTGKTGFAYHLSQLLELPLHHVRASNLLDMYVGSTEQNIANVFRKAKHEKAILLIDEADSLVSDRRSHFRSWETSQVNELLTQIECFQGILVVATNLEERLDQAMARRFDFKLEFDFLKPEQAASFLLEISDAKSLAPGVLEQLDQMPKLTPGDFAVVKRKINLGGKNNLNLCIDFLKQEYQYKVKDTYSAIGFVH